MLKFEEIVTTPTFSNQLENKMLFSNHANGTSISYQSTFTLKYVIEGVKYYSYNNQEFKVSKNQYLLLNDNSRITSEATKGTKGLSFFLSPELIKEIYQYHTLVDSPVEFIEFTNKRPNWNIQILLQKLVQLYEQDSFSFKQQMEILFIQISESIIQEQTKINTHFHNLNIIKHHTKRELYQLVLNAREYLHDNYNTHITLDAMGRDIGLSKYYLHRLFSELLGRTPIKYLNEIRLNEAKAKLTHTQKTISEIAVECGFDNVSYFSNSFRKQMGTSPSNFRQSI